MFWLQACCPDYLFCKSDFRIFEVIEVVVYLLTRHYRHCCDLLPSIHQDNKTRSAAWGESLELCGSSGFPHQSILFDRERPSNSTPKSGIPFYKFDPRDLCPLPYTAGNIS